MSGSVRKTKSTKKSSKRSTKRSRGKSSRYSNFVEEEEGPCICRNTEEDTTVPNVPPEFAVQMPETIEEYINNRALKKYFCDTYVTNVWVKKVKNTIPYICKCCKSVHQDLYKKVITHVLKGGELPSEIVQEEGGNKQKNSNKKKVLSCLFCQCTTITCPVQKRVLDIDKIRENTRIISQALTAPTNCSPRSDAAMCDLANKQGLVPFSRNDIFDKLENLGIEIDDYHLKYLLDDSSLSMSNAKCDVSTINSNESDKESSEPKYKACYGPEDGHDKCYRGKGVMYLIGAYELPEKGKISFKRKQEGDDDSDYSLEDDAISVKYRGLLTDDPLYGKDPCLCQTCFKRVEHNKYLFIFRRTVKKMKSPRGTLVCTCEIDPYDVLEGEVREESECQMATENIRKCEYNILMNNVITKWNKYVNKKKSGTEVTVDDSIIVALENLARFFYKGGMEDGFLSPSISYTSVSSASKPSSTDSDIICKIGVIANKLYKKFPPCQAMLEELEEKFNEGEGDADPMINIKKYAQELKIRMMPQKISLKKQSGGKKKEVYCDNHEKEEMVGLIKHEAEKLIQQNAPEEEAVPEDEETLESKPPRCPDSIVDTESDEENVERLEELIDALQKRNPVEDEDEEVEPPKPCTCGIPPLIKTTSEDHCREWIGNNWKDGYLLDRLMDNEEILVEFPGEDVAEEESNLANDYNKMVSTIQSKPEEKLEKEGKRERRDSKKDKQKEKEKKKKAKDKKGDKEARPSKRKKKLRRIRETVSPDQMEAHSLNYRQMVEYLHSRKNVSFKDITRLYKYPVLRLPAPQWRLRNKLLKNLRDRKIMMDDGKGHRMQIFILPRETWQGKVLSKPFISYGMLKRKIMPFRQKYPKWIKPINIKKFKKRNVINEEILKNLVFSEKDKGKKKKGESKDKKDKKKFCRSIRSKYRSEDSDSILPLLPHNYNINYYCSEIKDNNNLSLIDKIQLMKATMVQEKLEEQNNNINDDENNEENDQHFVSRKYLSKKKRKTSKAKLEEQKNNINGDENNEENEQYFVSRKYMSKKKRKTAEDDRDEQRNNNNEWFLDDRRLAKKRKKKTAKDEWEKHKNCEKYVVSLVKIPPDVVVKRKYLYKKIMVDPHRKLIVVELKRGQKHHSQSMVRYFIPFIVVSKTRLPTKRKKSDHPDHVVYLIRNAILKQIKTRFRLPSMRVFVRKLVELSNALFKLTMGYEVNKSTLRSLQKKKYELFGYRSMRGKPIEDIVLTGFNVIMYWLLFKLKLYTLYSLLRSEKFDIIMAPMVAQEKPIPENSSEWLEELKRLRFEIQCQTLMEVEEYGLESTRLKAKYSKMPTLAKALDKCRQCADPLSQLVTDGRALDLFNSLVALVKLLYDYDPPTAKSINAFKLPELIGSDDELFGAPEEVAEGGQKEDKAQQEQTADQQQIKQPEKKVGPAAEVPKQQKGEPERGERDKAAAAKIKKWMNYEFEYHIYWNQRSLTLEGLLEYIREGAEEGEQVMRRKSIDLDHVIPGLLGITVEGLMEAEKEKDKKGKKKGGGKMFLRAKSKKSCSCIRRGDPWRPTFQQLLVKEIYDLPEPMKLTKYSKSKRSLRKTRGKTVSTFGKPKLMIIPSGKPKLIVVKETNSEPAVIAKGELNIAVNIDKSELRKICTPILAKLNKRTINNLLKKISSQNLIKNKLIQFVSIAKHKKKLKPSYSDPILYKKSSPIISKDHNRSQTDRPKLKRTCSADEMISFEQNLAASKVINVIADHLEELLTLEVLSRRNRKVNSETALIKTKLPIIKKISVEKLIKKRRKKKKFKTVISKRINISARGSNQVKGSKSKVSRNNPNKARSNKSIPISNQGRKLEIPKGTTKKVSEDVTRKIGKNRTSEIVTNKASKSKNIRGNVPTEVTRKTSKKSGLQTNIPKEVTRKTSKKSALQTNVPTEVTRKTGKKSGLQTNVPTEVARKTSKKSGLQPNIPTEVTSKTNKKPSLKATEAKTKTKNQLNLPKATGPRKLESIKKIYNAEKKILMQKHQSESSISSNASDELIGNEDRGFYTFQRRRYCKSARRQPHLRTNQEITDEDNKSLVNQNEDPVKKISADTIVKYLRNRLAEIPQHPAKIRKPSITEVDLLVSSGDIQVVKKKSNYKIDRNESTDSHDKSCKKKSSFETDPSMKKKQYSSSTLCSLDAPTDSSKRRTLDKKHKSTGKHQ